MRPDHSKEFLIRFLSCYAGFVFRWQRYRTLSSNWNHDHCKGCSARFAERPDEWADPVHTAGWVTLWPVANTGETEEETRLKMACGRENSGSFWLNSAGSSWIGFVPSVLKRVVKN